MIHRHHSVPRSRGGADEDWNFVDIDPYTHAYEHALDFVLFEHSPRFDFRHEAWPLLPEDLKEAVLAETSRRMSKGEGNPTFGKSTPIEVKEKIAKSLTGRKASDETCKKLSKSLKGNQNRKGKPQPREAVERVRQQNLGRKNSTEIKERQKQAALKRWSDHRAQKIQNG